MRDYKDIENEIEGFIGAGHKIARNPSTNFPQVRARFIRKLGELCGELAVSVSSRAPALKEGSRYDEWVPLDGDYEALAEMVGELDGLDDEDRGMVEDLFESGYREGVAKAVAS